MAGVKVSNKIRKAKSRTEKPRVKSSIKIDVLKPNVSKPRILGKGVKAVQPIVKSSHSTCLSDIKKIIQESMKANNLSPEDAIRIIGDKRYER